MLMGLMWGIFVGLNVLTREFAPDMEFRIGQISVLGFALAVAELLVAWWISLKITNGTMNSMIARAEAREEEMARLDAEEAAKMAARDAAIAEAAAGEIPETGSLQTERQD